MRTTQSPSWVAWGEVRVYGMSAEPIAPTDASASGHYGANTPSRVFDRQVSTGWLSGGYAPQFVNLSLDNRTYVTRLRLMLNQAPPGPAQHRVLGGLDAGSLTVLRSFSTNGGTGTWVEVHVSSATPVRYLRIETLESPSWIGWQEILVDGKTDAPPCAVTSGADTLRFFGYFQSDRPWNNGEGSDVFGLPGQDNGYGDHGNLAWIQVTAWDSLSDPNVLPNPSLDIARLTDPNRPAGMKSVLHLNGLFFSEDFRLLGPAYPGATPKWLTNWNHYADSIAPYIGSVAAFYPLDEPYHNARKVAVSRDEMRAALETVSAAIKSRFPNTPVGVIFNYDELGAELADGYMPAGYDWVSFDCYAEWSNPSIDPWTDCVGRSIPAYIGLLREAMRPDQHMFLVPDAFIPYEDMGTSTLEQRVRLESLFEKYARFAQEDGRVIGIVPFVWHRLPQDGWDFFGARDLGPATRARFASFGNCVSR